MAKRQRISLITVLYLAILFALVLCGLNHSKDKAYSSTIYNYQSPTFTINSQSDFESFANTFSTTNNYFKDKTIYLNCNVDMGDYGSLLRRFDGTFYGNGNAISNLKNPLFGNEIAATGKVYDVVLNNINISNSNSSVAVYNYGQITNVKVIGQMTYNTIGGLCYDNYGEILDSYNFANLNVTGAINSSGVGGIVFKNYKIITNCHFLGNITANNTVKALGGIAAYNKNIQSEFATISKSSANAEIYINATGNESYDATLPENCGTLVGNNVGLLQNSYFIGYYTSYLTLPIVAVGNDSLLVEPNPYQNIYMMTQSQKLVYDIGTESFIEPVLDIKEYFDYSGLNSGIYVSENNSYPIFKFYDGLGTLENPFLAENVFDLYKLRALYNNLGVGYFVQLADDINCRNYTIEIDLEGFNYLSTIDGKGFALKNFGGQVLFTQNQEDILFDTGFYNSPNVNIVGTLFNEFSAYDYGGVGGANINIVKQEPVLGTGTELDPYIITTKEELAYLTGSSGYFVLGNSIAINSAKDTDTYYLNINIFEGVFDGNGYSIVGLFEPLITTNEGTVKSLTLKGVASANVQSLVVTNNIATGIIDSVDVYCSIPKTGIVFSGIASTNDAKISKVQVFGNDASQESSVSGICATNSGTGIIENCFVAMENTFVFAMENYGTIASSIGKDTDYIAVNNNAIVDMDYFILIENGFDVENVFGYEINTSLLYPTLRQSCVRYKNSSESIYNKTRTFNYTYSATTSYSKVNIQNLMKLKSEYITTGYWTYNGLEYTEATFQDAGSYEVTLIFNGDNFYLPSKYTKTVTINKQTQTALPTFDGDTFANITYNYLGEDIAIIQPVPNNLLECEYAYSYTLKQGSNTVSAIKNAGIYNQVITGESKNYSNVTKSRTIYINKATITITVGDLSINYLEDAILENADLTINGLVAQDELKSIQELKMAGTTPRYSSNYVKGNDVGEYSIDYLSEFTNYTVTNVAKGKLIVNKIDQDKESISFEDKLVTYSGYDIQITVANLAENASVVYDNNTYKDAGEYIVNATITRANYNDLKLSATLAISKATLTFTPKDITLSYAPTRTKIEQDFFSCDILGVKGSDDVKILASLISLNYVVTKDGERVNVFDVGIYDTEIERVGELQNYDIISEIGHVEIVPSSLKILYPTHSNYSATYDGEIKTHPITFLETTISYEYSIGQEIVENCINAGTYTAQATALKLNDNYLDTVYTYTITIAKADIDISFENVSYNVEYDKTNKASETLCPYVGALPGGLSHNFSVKKDGEIVKDAINAGEYVVSYLVAESENYMEKVIWANLIIMPKSIAITLKPNYTYTSNNIEPEITSISGAIDGEVLTSSFTFKYFSEQVVPQERITKVGNYVIRAIQNNPNYSLAFTDYEIVINKITASIDLKYLEYSYGFTGLLNYGGINYEIYSKGIIERKNYFVAETNTTMNIRYALANEHAGTYTVGAISVTENYNFVISPNSQLNDNKVKIIPFALSHIWKLGSTDIITLSKTIIYKGIDQTSEFGYTIYGFLKKNEKQEDFSFQMREVNSKSLYDAGQYRLEIVLLNENNYVMNNATLEVIIEKAVLNVKMLDVEVFFGEQFAHSYQVMDTVGEDSAIGDINRLKGVNLRVISDYTTKAIVGSEFEYYYEGTFTNYLLNITQRGKVRVIKNPKIPITVDDSTFIYDGTYKSLKVKQTQEVIDAANIDLQYSANNSQKDVGIYLINLVVTYNIDGSQIAFTRTMTILQSTPRAIMESNVKTVYKENYILLPKDIKGEAYLGDNEVAGTFVFVEDYLLEKGVKEGGYQVKFIPNDTKNLKTISSIKYNIESVVVNLSALVYSDITKIGYTGNELEISDTVTMTLNASIIAGLTLYKNDVLVDSIVLDKREDMIVSIKYNDEVVFSQNIKVVLEENKDNVVIDADESYLDLISGLTIDKKTLFVSSKGGRIGLDAEHLGKYELYINGLKVDNNYPINGNEGTLTIAIVDIKSSFTVFSAQYEVKISDTVIEQPKEKDYTVLIITLSVVGGAGLLVGAYFLLRKVIRDKKMGFNPYNKK